MSLSLRCTINWRYSQKQVTVISEAEEVVSFRFQTRASCMHWIGRKQGGPSQSRSERCGGEQKILCSCRIRNSEEVTGNWWWSGTNPTFLWRAEKDNENFGQDS